MQGNNDRSRRTPDPIGGESAPPSGGHGIDDIGARLQSADDDDAKVRRTPREATPPREAAPPTRTHRDSSGSGSRTTIPGNTSETGAGTPIPANGAPRKMPVGPGCATTTGALTILSVALAASCIRLIRR